MISIVLFVLFAKGQDDLESGSFKPSYKMSAQKSHHYDKSNNIYSNYKYNVCFFAYFHFHNNN